MDMINTDDKIVARSTSLQRPYSSVLIIPTGVGASIGGFAGDGLPVARAMSSLCDNVITHPNVLNAAMLYWPIPNIQYVEGYALDCFAKGDWGLAPVHQNKIGLVLDLGIERDLQLRHLQVIDAASASLGLSIVDHVVTDKPLGVQKWINEETGQSTGQLLQPDSLMRAVDSLLYHSDANAIAVVARFPDDSLDDISDYRQGQGVDALAGVEAVISHMIVEKFRIPCAHAPALSPLPLNPTISPRSAAEEIGYTFLPSVLAGLSRAPQFIIRTEQPEGFSHPQSLWAHDIDSIVIPINACGGAGTVAFSQAKHKPLLIAVEENETVLDDTPEKLQIEVVRAANYWEALGIIAAHKAGVHPMSLRRFREKDVGHCYTVSKPLREATASLHL
ncbi:hypothetical protein KP509_34G057500 [Ceratopteris richardii]|uniref:DUF3326 domain-containing protein n=1 Tax=Ceratopteris richardii TaxID=49495 RepID=A0A8T2QMI2_CERRI|nr:hypothetical protein KP509_34G057500 [Ceratopteris richardii]